MSRIVWILMLFLVGVPIAAQEPTTFTFTYEHLSFTYNRTLIDALTIEEQPAATRSETDPWWAAKPSALHLTFQPAGELYLYRTEDFAVPDLNEYRERHQQLLAMLDERPDLSGFTPTDLGSSVYPILRPVPSGQTFLAQGRYQTFQNGEGIRYLTSLAQDYSPGVFSMFYTFQGVTTDGETYVALSIPVSVSAFTEKSFKDFDPYYFYDHPGSYDEYMRKQVVEPLNALPAADFTPSLAQLDALVESLIVLP